MRCRLPLPDRSVSRLAALLALALAGCATPPPPGAADWQALALPGKRPTQYEWTRKDGRPALQARSERSASLWRRRVEPAAPQVAQARFSWWLQDAVPSADLADAERTDAPARVMFGFGGDVGRLSLRTRLAFDLAQALTGEQPPYATLVYVWDPTRPVGTVVPSPHSDRVRYLVVDSGPDALRQWREHERDLPADFRRAFGEEPGPLTSVALMTDSDNTRSQSRAWYGPVEWR